ncbi:flagellar biosynthesis repressor FlbT [Microvirga sp. WGZ8]|uniref:Flagellar biosynthesis repressor FlbT n=1 Tax=Microvirga puerhi TaxID=2876078 RepID=A0ABS7VUU4_9HYPH|nr:flagellar biosynthesis repressor FlbT [Microvirga puerhi]MBZ6079340.1 flagellar biosynthesis repressor FlbT [Microvirga puerhi]
MHLSLKAGERIFINGAVLRVDRKVSIELLNDATFLLENHVLQVDDATTPLRQLYFVVQAILVDPSSADKALAVFKDLYAATLDTFSNKEIMLGLQNVAEMVHSNRPFDALKVIRGLFAVESTVLSTNVSNPPHQAA